MNKTIPLLSLVALLGAGCSQQKFPEVTDTFHYRGHRGHPENGFFVYVAPSARDNSTLVDSLMGSDKVALPYDGRQDLWDLRVGHDYQAVYALDRQGKVKYDHGLPIVKEFRQQL